MTDSLSAFQAVDWKVFRTPSLLLRKRVYGVVLELGFIHQSRFNFRMNEVIVCLSLSSA